MDITLKISGASYQATVGLPDTGNDWSAMSVFVRDDKFIKAGVKEAVQKSGYKFANEHPISGVDGASVCLVFKLEVKGLPAKFNSQCHAALNFLGISDEQISAGIKQEAAQLERFLFGAKAPTTSAIKLGSRV